MNKPRRPYVSLDSPGEVSGGSQFVILKSKRNHNIYIMYDGSTLVLPPGGKTSKLEASKLGTIPSGVIKIEVK